MKRTENQRVLLVEDDELVALTVKLYLEKHGCNVTHVASGTEALALLAVNSPDAVLLDCMLPDMDGIDVCRAARVTYGGPILMLTARSEDPDHVMGLENGADQYLIKPMEPRVLLAHLRAALRRSGPGMGHDTADICFGRFRINSATRDVQLDNKSIALSTAEFDLLWLLASRAGTILSRDEIFVALRGLEHDGLDRSIDMRISRLRKVLGDDADQPRRIKTVRGRGYLFSPTDWA